MPVRVHELAAELGVTSKQVMGLAADLGLAITSPSSVLGTGTALQLRTAWLDRTTRVRTVQNIPPKPIGNNPYSPPRRLPPHIAKPSRRTPHPTRRGTATAAEAAAVSDVRSSRAVSGPQR